jgi:hypothetical protein
MTHQGARRERLLLLALLGSCVGGAHLHTAAVLSNPTLESFAVAGWCQ